MRDRVNVIVDDQNKLITIRPIGVLPRSEFVDQVFEHLANVEHLGSYSRVRDLRRWQGELDRETEDEISRRWAKATDGQFGETLIAVVTADPTDMLRTPRQSAAFPQETRCDFTDYHEAVGWLLADDRSAYLAGLGQLPVRRRDAHQIRIE